MVDSNLNVIRTQEELINVLSVLYFNLNEIERIYYDMFINPVEMDVTFQRYDDLGVLSTITLPNRAKSAHIIYTGAGNPNGTTSASAGTLYLDTASLNLYYKSSGSDAQGWVLLYSTENSNFLTPDGDASHLRNLNMNFAGTGVLSVERGGTGNSGLAGIIKGNNREPFTTAVDGKDYMGPTSMTGCVIFYPVSAVPYGWLICDGLPYKKSDYSNLATILGTTYGTPTLTEIQDAYPNETNIVVSDWFKVPNFKNYFLRCWDGTSAFNSIQQDHVGKHKHTLTGKTSRDGSHYHGKGSWRIVGEFANEMGQNASYKGAFYGKGRVANDSAAPGGVSDALVGFDTDREGAWIGRMADAGIHEHTISGEATYNSEDAETRVLNKMVVPIIKW